MELSSVVQATMKQEQEVGMASIYSIVYKPEGAAEGDDRRGRYVRVPIESARLIVDHGIEGDRKGGHNPTRQLNLLSLEWLETIKPKGYKTEPGQFGEQIIISGLLVQGLEPGTRLRLGDEACIEISQTRTGCDRLEAAQGKTREGLGPLGVLARVVTGGTIKVGDTVTVLDAVPSVAAAQETIV
jgi:MOSC domain-containing protein YiiM